MNKDSKALAVIENSKDFFKIVAYNIKYGRKFKKFNIDKSLSERLIARSKGLDEKAVWGIISKSKNKEEFEDNIKDYFKSSERNIYAGALLVGNVTGKYYFSYFYFNSVDKLNIDSFSKDNNDLLLDLKSHFYEYVMDSNKRKNTFAQRIKVGDFNDVRDLSKDIDEDGLAEEFEEFLNGVGPDNTSYRSQAIMDYLMKTIGTYSREDIKNNFDFVLYDINSEKKSSLEERRNRYLLHSKLSNSQLRKIDGIDILKKRLRDIGTEESEELLSRLSEIGNNFDENISQIEDIYSDYEILYREDLIDNLYVPKEDVTIIDNYKDIRPQLIHKFMGNAEKFRKLEISKIKDKIISERTDGNNSKELTEDEQKRLENMKGKIDANIDQYKVNYTTDGEGTIYSGSWIWDIYHSDTTNQISASIFQGDEFINSRDVGIVGIGFNKETLTPEAIAISSNSYKTTNKGLNNLEYDEEHEFKEMSAPLSELIKEKGESEIVMHRRGMDFDTKASYIFAIVDSSDSEKTQKIMKQLQKLRDEEGLKAVIYDIYKIRESLKQIKEESREEGTR